MDGTDAGRRRAAEPASATGLTSPVNVGHHGELQVVTVRGGTLTPLMVASSGLRPGGSGADVEKHASGGRGST